MIRRVDTDQIVGVSEIASHAGVTVQAVVNWQSRYEGFPKPLKALECGPIYYLPDIEKWMKSTGRGI